MIVVAGLAGPNLGDTAIASVLVDVAHALGQPVTIIHPGVVANPVPEADVSLRFRRTAPADWARAVAAMRTAAVVAIGGGSLVQDRNGISFLRGVLPFTLQCAIAARLVGQDPLLLGVGFDSLSTKLGKIYAQRLAQICGAPLVVRDPASARRMRVFRDPSAISVVPDPAFCLALPQAVEEPSHDLAFIPSRHEADANRVAQWVATARNLLHPGERVLVVTSDNSEEEVHFANALFDALRPSDVLIDLFVPKDLPALLAKLRTCKKLISMRLHPLIFSYGVIPSAALASNDKIRALCAQTNIPIVDLKNGITETLLIRLNENMVPAQRQIREELGYRARYGITEAIRSRLRLPTLTR